MNDGFEPIGDLSIEKMKQWRPKVQPQEPEAPKQPSRLWKIARFLLILILLIGATSGLIFMFIGNPLSNDDSFPLGFVANDIEVSTGEEIDLQAITSSLITTYYDGPTERGAYFGVRRLSMVQFTAPITLNAPYQIAKIYKLGFTRFVMVRELPVQSTIEQAKVMASTQETLDAANFLVCKELKGKAVSLLPTEENTPGLYYLTLDNGQTYKLTVYPQWPKEWRGAHYNELLVWTECGVDSQGNNILRISGKG